MRFISAFAMAAGLVALGGCALMYDYSDFHEEDTPGEGGAGGDGGTGGTGGTAGSGPCEPNVTESCFTGPPAAQNVRPCQAGTRTCLDNGTWGTCVGEVLPGVELCRTDNSESCNAVPCPEAMWSRRYGDDKDQEVLAAAVDGAGNVLLAGRYQGVLALDTRGMIKLGPSNEVTTDDAFVAMFSSDGNPAWIWGVKLGQQPRRAIAAASGEKNEAVFAGYYTTSQGDRDAFLAWGSGAGVNVVPLNAAGDEEPVAVAVDHLGFAYLVGTVRGMGTLPCNGAANADFNAGDEDLFVLSYNLALSQCRWAHVFPGGIHKPRAMAVDAAGNVYVTGSYTGTMNIPGVMVPDAGAKARAFVLKLDGKPDVQWIRTFGEAGGDAEGAAIAVDASSIAGKVFVTGTMSGTVVFGDQTFMTNGKDTFVLALDKTSGDPKWSTQLAGNQDEHGTGLALTADGDALVAGHFSGTMQVPTGAELTSTDNNVFLIRLSPEGAPSWAHRFGGTGEPLMPRSVRVATGPSGAVLAGGWITPLDFPPKGALSPYGGLDVFLTWFPIP
ncbi:hypothetical protein [Polyangium sp. 15x6]|uniref:hypothetical protein n=1 Tax=Polyangium sp. 15x6 TaxID=3042687 RepID=UPI002499B974|nr:hypothetical protein [Polyangium sp. 15x6]MDI3287440.1 hypothetical protein [Polyangium sp. 15x6]